MMLITYALTVIGGLFLVAVAAFLLSGRLANALDRIPAGPMWGAIVAALIGEALGYGAIEKVGAFAVCNIFAWAMGKELALGRQCS